VVFLYLCREIVRFAFSATKLKNNNENHSKIKPMTNYLKEVGFAVTISDKNGQVLAMNDKALSTFEKYGGAKLIGTSLYDCHPPHATEIIKRLMESHETNAYTIEKMVRKN